MKLKLLRLLIGMLILLEVSLVSAEPNYSLSVALKEKSVNIGEDVKFIVSIHGGGVCDEAELTILSDALLRVKNNRLSITHFEGLGNEFIPTIITTPGRSVCIAGSKEIPLNSDYSDIYSDIYIQSLNNVFRNENSFRRYLISGNLTTKKDTKGGNYDIDVIFSCRNNNTWYNFKGGDSLKVLFKWEAYQYLFQFGLLFVAILSIILSMIIATKNKPGGT